MPASGFELPRWEVPIDISQSLWLEISIDVPFEFVDPVAQLFSRVNAGNVVLEEAGGHNPDNGELPPVRPTTTVRTYIDASSELQNKRELIHICLGLFSKINPLPLPNERYLNEDEWKLQWKAHFTPLSIGNKLLVTAPFHSQELIDGKIRINIDPDMAFGTGHHPTTGRCLHLLERLTSNNSAVLDLGSGSGILGIAAAKLGAKTVIGLEVDQTAVEISRRNAHSNDVATTFAIYPGTLPHPKISPGSIDILVANISSNVIISLAPRLHQVLVRGGLLIASGILDHQMPQVQDALLEVGFTSIEIFPDDDWETLLLRREG